MTEQEREIYLKGYANGRKDLCKYLRDAFHRNEAKADEESGKPENLRVSSFYRGMSCAFGQCRMIVLDADYDITKFKSIDR
ncbi:hypothetical protein QPK24_03020 [Paenibacillus polygoni]|uniref:Uncharacterized protein n=1 Tax=Paenibacillus polygoni TaxID=3050112 RepID=A0ABY8X690_9BACL|nr:hypothetical protein [Paenibacillus polygoni]WIV19733.1 hypothetical protein QPK24_03020 [Paenibacillus polygoni]